MIRTVLFLWTISWLLGLASCSKPTNGASLITGEIFPNCEYQRVVAYHYEGEDGSTIISDKQELHASIYKEQVLNPTQITQILGVLNDPNSYGGHSTRCFKPHLGIVFYSADNKPLSHTSICFMCNNQSATPQIRAEKQAPLAGFSEEGRRKLLEFCQSLSFGHCGDDNIPEKTEE